MIARPGDESSALRRKAGATVTTGSRGPARLARSIRCDARRSRLSQAAGFDQIRLRRGPIFFAAFLIAPLTAQSLRPSMHSHLAIRHLIRHVAERRQSGIGQPVLPTRLVALIDDVCQMFEPFTGVARAGYECLYGGDRWEIAVFLGEQEAIGGALDGEVAPVNFRFNVQGLTRLFEQVHSVAWNAIPCTYGTDDDVPFESFLTIDGVAAGERISLQVHALAPREIGPAVRQYQDGRLELV